MAKAQAKIKEQPQVGLRVPGNSHVADPEVFAQVRPEPMAKFIERQNVRAEVLPLISKYRELLASRSTVAGIGPHNIPGDWSQTEKDLTLLETQIGSALTAGKGAWDNGLQKLANDFTRGSAWTREGTAANLAMHQAALANQSRVDARNLGLEPNADEDQRALDAAEQARQGVLSAPK